MRFSRRSTPSMSIAAGQAVRERLRDERMVGNLAIAAREVLGARELIREHRRQQILGIHALELRGLPSCRCGSAGPRARCSRSSASTRRTIGASSTACVSTSRTVLLDEIPRDLVEREAVHRAERDHDRVLERGGLQLEVEAPAEPLAQRQAPGAIDARAERRMHRRDACRPSRRRNARRSRASSLGSAPSAAFAAAEVVDELLAPRCRFKPSSSTSHATAPAAPPRSMSSAMRLVEPPDRRRQLVAAARRLAEPERNRRRLTLRVRDVDLARLDLLDAIRRVAELEHVAGHALEREVLVQRADRQLARQQHDVVVELIRNRAAVRDRP